MPGVQIPEGELEFKAIRASGPGGQHVNKASTAIQLRFDSQNSSLPELIKEKILTLSDRRINSAGVIVITSKRFRNQEANRLDAIKRLERIIEKASTPQKKRRPTRPTRASKERRLKKKSLRSSVKRTRSNIDPNSLNE
ncbi:MAG: aminoacyl-tRNA hydrolase [Candidatus Marinimicrobia bacterium]|nr:aminoacyl-tRNA hydrolase [Candidatus Neomarinimicrobiota bacterium]MCF7903959.1 aminoacyl-tRNA hydrolase [Candidatus Neomarinimicrobiota bacterium]